MSIQRARSALYVPADHARAMAKSVSLAADILIYDLEDGVAPASKPAAREALRTHFQQADNAHLRLVRINHQSTRFYIDDITAMSAMPADGIMLSKVAHTADINDAVEKLARAERADMAIWCNVETPEGILNAATIAAHPNVVGLVAGTNDLANDLRIIRTAERTGLMHALQLLLLAARANHRIILDGTFVDLEDMKGLEAEAQQGRMLGFDGKTLIHPKQIDSVNRIFSPSEDEMTQAKRIIKAYEAAMKEHKAVTLLDNQMIEQLHYDRARQLLAQAD